MKTLQLFKNLLFILVIVALFISQSPLPVLAVNSTDLEAIHKKHPFYSPEDECVTGSSANTSGGYDPTSLNFPQFPDDAAIAANIDTYVRDYEPESPWLKISNLGTWIVSETKSRNVNPMLVVSIGRQENAFGTTGNAPRDHNNFFGMKGGDGYQHFGSPEEGMVAFFDALKRNIVDRTHANYKEVTTFYEYISVHQTGGIHYPGDGLDASDPLMPGTPINWDSSYNPAVYWRTVASVITTITGIEISPEVPPRGGLPSVACGGSSLTAAGSASEYIADCGVNGGNAAIACTAINQLMGLPYSRPNRAAPTDPDPKFLDCSALVSMAIYRTFGTDLGGICSVDFLSNVNFETIDVGTIRPGDLVGRGVACGGAGHIAIVVSYDPVTKKLITVETGSPKYPSGLRGIGGPGGYDVGLEIDGKGSYEWAVRYSGPKILREGAL
jgi:hypothetical protein